MRWTWKEINRRKKRATQLLDWVDWSYLDPRLHRKDRKTRKKFLKEAFRLTDQLERWGLWP
jgi:trans-aconitate methyltransferase